MVRVVGGPWPERIGCVGVVVEPIPADQSRYPFHGLGRDEIVIVIADDPLLCQQAHEHGGMFCNGGTPSRTETGRPWTCVIDSRDVEIVPTMHVVGLVEEHA